MENNTVLTIRKRLQQKADYQAYLTGKKQNAIIIKKRGSQMTAFVKGSFNN